MLGDLSKEDINPLRKLNHAFLILSLSTLAGTSNQTSNSLHMVYLKLEQC